ncbi:MAG: hypothetical protein R6U66_06155 [Bacteroidales bacterium]
MLRKNYSLTNTLLTILIVELLTMILMSIYGKLTANTVSFVIDATTTLLIVVTILFSNFHWRKGTMDNYYSLLKQDLQSLKLNLMEIGETLNYNQNLNGEQVPKSIKINVFNVEEIRKSLFHHNETEILENVIGQSIRYIESFLFKLEVTYLETNMKRMIYIEFENMLYDFNQFQFRYYNHTKSDNFSPSLPYANGADSLFIREYAEKLDKLREMFVYHPNNMYLKR